jgi:hypothetical protein
MIDFKVLKICSGYYYSMLDFIIFTVLIISLFQVENLHVRRTQHCLHPDFIFNVAKKLIKLFLNFFNRAICSSGYICGFCNPYMQLPD